MNKVTPSVIEKLSEPQSSPVLSIYIPTHRHPIPPHTQEDQIRFKNALSEAETLLEEDEIDNRGVHANMQVAYELLSDLVFWRTTLEGLALFINEQEVQVYHSPIEFEESVTYDDVFDVAPLHMIQAQDVEFHVLVLAMHGSKIYRGDAYGLEEIAINLPKSPEDALDIDELFANSRTVRSHGGGTAPHGEGDSTEAGEHERLQYFRIIEQRLHDHDLFNDLAPLVVAATDSEAGNFRAVTSLSGLLPHYIPGNHMDTSTQELFAMAWPIIRSETIQKDESEIVERFGEYMGNFRASVDAHEIEEAAEEGRIETLLVDYIDETYDSVSDTKKDPAPVIRTTVETNREQLRRLIDLVYNQGGKIIGLEHSRMPKAASAAALYRY